MSIDKLRHKPLRAPMIRRDGPAWPEFRGSAEEVGKSAGGVTVYVDPTLGQAGNENAQTLVQEADEVVAKNNAIFGSGGGEVDVLVFAKAGATDGTGGADHGGCDFSSGGAIEVDASFGSAPRILALFEAELSECAMNGNLCGVSTGEALSRWCAAVVSSDALADFASAPTWASSGMPNWVDTTENSDQGMVSIGCGMAFISWLISKGHNLSEVAQAMVQLGDSGTLAALYASLTSEPQANAWNEFKAAVEALGGVSSDDPFGAIGSALAPLHGHGAPHAGAA
jgi:hypothetical protein